MGSIVTLDEIINKLTQFGFSKTDAMVYIAFLKLGKCSGYKIAKEIGLSRSSVYSSIDSLFAHQYIHLSDSQTKEYTAKPPNQLFEELEKQTLENCALLKKELHKLFSEEESKEFIFNLTGYDAWLKKAKDSFAMAQNEIYLNTDFNLDIFKTEIEEALNRGVRIIIFSFHKLMNIHPAIESYSRLNEEETLFPSRRFMMVVDMKNSIIFSNSNNHCQGVYTNNELMLKIAAEHIHSDIYLSKYQHLSQKDITDNILIKTLHERVNNLSIYEKK
ncbi:TrmB family transcriptional regulator [Thorsellia kenyensis]|uniref:TrmB family transcriptional regulator n=1 Tax=Thorsellia kenyensis TaxID=1549888 RepID=A0ABV6CD58_9GAMM